jgi:hypothetical protein
MSGRYTDVAMRAIQGGEATTKTTLTTKAPLTGLVDEASGDLCRLNRLCRTPSSKIPSPRVCAQCGAGPSTDPPSDAPNVRSGEVWVHPECRRFWKAGSEAV